MNGMAISLAGTPLALLGKKQRVGSEAAQESELQVLLYLDAARRGLCPTPCANGLAEHLIVAVYIAKRVKSGPFLRQVMAAYDALTRAMARPTRLLDLTTREYTALRAAFATYARALPAVEIGVMAEAQAELRRVLAL
jgi:hypothetical protein